MCNATTYSESGAPIAPTRCAEYVALKEENARLRAILAPLIAHAARHDYAPPYMLNVQQCREIKEKVNG
jgi:hypothetical protein